MRKIRIRIQEIANEQGLTSGMLAARAGMPARMIHRLYCNPHANVGLKALAKIAEALGVPTSQLMEDVK